MVFEGWCRCAPVVAISEKEIMQKRREGPECRRESAPSNGLPPTSTTAHSGQQVAQQASSRLGSVWFARKHQANQPPKLANSQHETARSSASRQRPIEDYVQHTYNHRQSQLAPERSRTSLGMHPTDPRISNSGSRGQAAYQSSQLVDMRASGTPSTIQGGSRSDARQSSMPDQNHHRRRSDSTRR